MSQPKMRIGWSVSRKKQSKFIVSFVDYVQSQVGVTIEQVLADESGASVSDASSSVDVLLHKLVDEMYDVRSEAMANNSSAVGNSSSTPSSLQELSTSARKLSSLRRLVEMNPQMMVVDPLCSVELVMDRASLLGMLTEKGVECPCFALWDPLQEQFAVVNTGTCLCIDSIPSSSSCSVSQIRFPVVVKTNLSCGHPVTHRMMVVNTPAQLLAAVKSMYEPRSGLVIQNWVAHDGVVAKVYTIGKTCFTANRDSLTLSSGCTAPSCNVEAVAFDSQSFGQPKPDCAAASQLPVDDPLYRISEHVGKALGLSLYGVDVITETGTGRRLVVDVNYFPGYKEVPNVNEILFAHLREQWTEHQEHCLK